MKNNQRQEYIMEEKNPIQVADRLFLVLETLASDGPIALADLSRQLALNKSTVPSALLPYLYGICKTGYGHTEI